MTAYLNIFEWKYFALAVLLAIILISALAHRAVFMAKSMLLSTAIWLAPIYYLSYVIFQSADNFSVHLALLTETVILVTWLAILGTLFRHTAAARQGDMKFLANWLNISIFVQLAVICYFVTQPNFGIFSDGSRIEYLEGSRLNIYLTYISAIAAAGAAPIAASIVNINQRWDKRAVIYIVVVLAGSLLSGSKGIGVLILISVICYIGISNRRIHMKIVLKPVMAAALFAVATVLVVGTYLQLDAEEMTDLMLNRVFLANDGRALAIDLSTQLNQPNISLFQESFRAPFSVAGSPPLNAPLGQLLYQEAFSVTTLSGANTSSTALLVAYGSDLEKFAFALSLQALALLVFLFSKINGRNRVIRLSLALLLLTLLSQDFLAFQVTFNLTIAASLLYYAWHGAGRLLTTSSAHREPKKIA